VRLSAPQIPFVSTVTGDWIKTSEVTDPAYWAGHLRSPVQFSKAVQVLLQDSQQVLVECGPRRTCVALAHQHRPANPGRVIGCMPDTAEPNDEYASMLLGLGALWANGCAIDWPAFHEHEARRRVGVPGYSFQRKRYWIDPGHTARAESLASPQPVKAGVASEGKPMEATGHDEVMTSLLGLLEEALGAKLESFDEEAQFIALGLDSLLVTQLARMVRVRLGFSVTFRQLTELYSTPKLLADAIRAGRGSGPAACGKPAEKTPCKAEAAPSPIPATPSAPPQPAAKPALDPSRLPGARLGRDEHGRPAWFVPDPKRPGKYLKVESHE